MSMVGDSSIAYCAEEWGEYKKGRLVYSIFSLVVQVRSDRGSLTTGERHCTLDLREKKLLFIS
jgi:hypothetical protein